MIDWVELWILNEVVLKPANVTRLIEAPQIQPEPYWDFPGYAYFEASVMDRVDRVTSLIEKGYLSLLNIQKNAFPTPYIDQRFHSATKNAFAGITQAGFDEWSDHFSSRLESVLACCK